jgi:putative MFS transporter
VHRDHEPLFQQSPHDHAGDPLLHLAGDPEIQPVDRMGRRPVLIGGFAVSALGLAYLAMFPHSSLWAIALAFAVYAIFNGGPSILEWIYPNELFPTEVRAAAVGLCTDQPNRGSRRYVRHSVGSHPARPLDDHVDRHCDRPDGAIVSWFMAPETKGRTLQQTARL